MFPRRHAVPGRRPRSIAAPSRATDREHGRIDRVLEVPATRVTSCAFGGTDLRTLFITTARQKLTPDELAAQPFAGSVLAITLDVCGLPESRFGAALPL